MDGQAAIENNRQALMRILAGIAAMAGLGDWEQFIFSSEKAEERRGREESKLSPAPTLPRRLYFAVLRLLRPAESAARRLIVASARGIVVTLPPARPAGPPSTPPVGAGIPLASLGLANLAHIAAPRRAAGRRPDPARPLPFPLLDPLRNPFSRPRRAVAWRDMPRISFLGRDDPRPAAVPGPPSPDDPVDATRLARRIAALASALGDLPREARRFARWKAARDAAGAQNGQTDAGRIRRLSPLRPGRPPGGRLSRFGPDAAGPQGRNTRRNVREVDEVLAHAHALAVYALEYPDTS